MKWKIQQVFKVDFSLQHSGEEKEVAFGLLSISF